VLDRGLAEVGTRDPSGTTTVGVVVAVQRQRLRPVRTGCRRPACLHAHVSQVASPRSVVDIRVCVIATEVSRAPEVHYPTQNRPGAPARSRTKRVDPPTVVITAARVRHTRVRIAATLDLASNARDTPRGRPRDHTGSQYHDEDGPPEPRDTKHLRHTQYSRATPRLAQAGAALAVRTLTIDTASVTSATILSPQDLLRSADAAFAAWRTDRPLGHRRTDGCDRASRPIRRPGYRRMQGPR
jgi:hypothetical protein